MPFGGNSAVTKTDWRAQAGLDRNTPAQAVPSGSLSTNSIKELPRSKTFLRRYPRNRLRYASVTKECPMSDEQRDPPPAKVGLSAEQRLDLERAAAWAYYLNGGGGTPEYFDRPTWQRMQERSR
jgi:hypothetical protein